MLKTRARDHYWRDKDRCHERDVKCREHRKSCTNTDTPPRPQAFSQRSISRQRRTHLLELPKIAKLSAGAKRVQTQTEGHAEIQTEQPQREPTRAPRTKDPPSMQPDTSVFSIAHPNQSSTSRLLAPDLTLELSLTGGPWRNRQTDHWHKHSPETVRHGHSSLRPVRPSLGDLRRLVRTI